MIRKISLNEMCFIFTRNKSDYEQYIGLLWGIV